VDPVSVLELVSIISLFAAFGTLFHWSTRWIWPKTAPAVWFSIFELID
jgi:hypothetical protein